MIYGSFDRFHAAETDVVILCIRKSKESVCYPYLFIITIPGPAAQNLMRSCNRSPGVFSRA